MLVSFVSWYHLLALFAWLFVLAVFALLAVACRTGGTDAWLDWHLPLRWCDPCPPSVRGVNVVSDGRMSSSAQSSPLADSGSAIGDPKVSARVVSGRSV